MDSAGKRVDADFKFSGGLYYYNHVRLDPGQQFKLPPTELEFHPTKDAVDNAPHKKGFEYSSRFNAPVGLYNLHLDYRIGRPEYADLPTPPAPGEKLEWTGLLTMPPVPLTVLPK
jgi:hypothetical protein